MTLAAIALVAAAATGLAFVFARQDDERPPVLVDEQSGVLHGVRFGDSEREVQQLLGEETDDRDGVFPEGANYTGPPVIRTPESDRGSRIPPSELHHGDTSYLVSPTIGVFTMSTLEQGARTRAGVGVGDDLELVRARYRRTECGAAAAGESLLGGEQPTYPWCRAFIARTRVFFGEDPIESITLTRYVA